MTPALSLQSTVKLRSGYDMPRLGFGLWKTPPEEAERCCNDALRLGYRHIDSAASYRNEAGCGKAIRGSGVARSDIFFTSKVRTITYEGARDQVAKTLAETGLEYVDLMLLHCPYGGSANRKGAWRALVEAVDQGKVRSIGVSNYGVHHLDELERHMAELEAERPGGGGVLSVGQYEIHPWCARDDVTGWLRARGVAIEAYSPLVRGERWGEPALARLAARHGKTEAQVLIRWSLDQGFVPLPKSVNEARIKANADVFDFSLSEDEIRELKTDEYKPVCWDPVKSGLDE